MISEHGSNNNCFVMLYPKNEEKSEEFQLCDDLVPQAGWLEEKTYS